MNRPSNPLVSIIIPAFNAGELIRKTIQSILKQTHTDYECLIINDGSTDNTLDILKEFKDQRIIIHTILNHGGPSKPRNIGLKNARGKYIFIFDSDDLMEPTKLEECINIFECYDDADFIFSDFKSINEENLIINESFLSIYQSFRGLLTQRDGKIFSLAKDELPNELVKANFIGTSSVAIRANKLTEIEIFNESLKSGDDLLAWIKLSEKMNFYFINKPLHAYRVTKTNISNTNLERLLNNKIIVLNTIISQYKLDKILLKDCLDKRSEYNFGLAYYYSSNRDFILSLVIFLIFFLFILRCVLR